jgi:elongation factor Ts
MEITTEQLKALRDATGISVMQCRKALEEAEGDMDKARVILTRKGGEAALKKSDRTLGAGVIGAYVHSTGEVAALVHLACETDFVAKNEEFIQLARSIAMQVAAQNPQSISRADVDANEIEKAKQVFFEEVKDKPADIQEKILSGKLDAYFRDRILLEQPYIKEPEKTIGELVNSAIQKFGENVVVARIERLSVK